MPDIQLPETIQISLDDDEQSLLQLNLIPKGSFLMGSRGNLRYEEPVHLVEILYDFYLGIYPVTQKQFAVWTQQAGVEHENGFPGNDSHPAEDMDWFQARQYCDWLNVRFEQQFSSTFNSPPAVWKVRLPREAEWEYACSAWQEMDDSTDPQSRIYMDYHTGDGPGALEMAGWFADNSDNTTHPVGRKQANRHGLFDMHGNVWEWCEDVWDEYAYCNCAHGFIASSKEEDNQDTDDAYRVPRGGSWFDRATHCRAAFRVRGLPAYRAGATVFGWVCFRS
ncbi:MAG: formylglycine-generating enzyme family protein, partial [Granulosicoccus sp.]